MKETHPSALQHVYLTFQELENNPLCRVPWQVERKINCVQFTDDDGDWEIVVRKIEGGRK